MKRAANIEHLIEYSKKGLFVLFAFICVIIHAHFLMAIDKPDLQEFKTDEAFDPLKFETLHPDSAINRKANA